MFMYQIHLILKKVLMLEMSACFCIMETLVVWYYINSNMSCYRRGVPTSWSERIGNPNNEEPFIAHHKKMIAMLKKYNNYTNNIYQDSINQRIAQHLFCVLILSKKSSVLVKKENKCYFKLYAKKKQLFVIYAIFFPKMAKRSISQN